MSAKAVIQGLEDSELIRMFLDFIAAHRLHYQKIRKEISYKCFEATWILPIAKATGYGRTETQAYKNALKNLLELLMEDPTYVQYFSSIMLKPQHQKDTSPPPKGQLKTEGQQPDDKTKMQYESFSRVGSKGKQDIQHSKINLNRSMSYKADSDIEQAKNKVKMLQSRLGSVLEENKVLRERLINCQDRPTNYQEKTVNFQQRPRQAEVKKIGTDSEKQLKKTNQTQKSQKTLLLESSAISKIAIPKLNLQVLPNYHKKSQKCLNEVLLAAYQEKHGPSKVC